MKEAKVGKVVDVRGRSCPVPTILTEKALKRVNAGELVKVVGASPVSKDRILRTIVAKGHEILGVKGEGAEFTITIKKGLESKV
ncbi:MAG: sulfurtransferase TusA family protein [Candidatus Bathyarchaeia archaeon]